MAAEVQGADAAGQALEWDEEKRRPSLVEEKCLSCMLCSFVCPVPDLIAFKEMPATWNRSETQVIRRHLQVLSVAGRGAVAAAGAKLSLVMARPSVCGEEPKGVQRPGPAFVA